jgi:hypothetical protein
MEMDDADVLEVRRAVYQGVQEDRRRRGRALEIELVA